MRAVPSLRSMYRPIQNSDSAMRLSMPSSSSLSRVRSVRECTFADVRDAVVEPRGVGREPATAALLLLLLLLLDARARAVLRRVGRAPAARRR